MDQATLAANTGMSPAYLSKRLNEQMGFSLFDVERLAEAFGVDPQGLMLEAVREANLLCDDA